jgi:hypothetical protein
MSDVVFAQEDALWDEFPFAPHVPAGHPGAAHPGDRRVIGRLGGDPVSITDLPAHWNTIADGPSYAHPQQHFATARDYLEWILETARRTRFLGAGARWPADEQMAVALDATRAGLEWDLDGNVIVEPHSLPLGSDWRRQNYRLEIALDGTWSVHDLDAGRNLDYQEAAAALASQLYDVAAPSYLFDVQVVIPS